MKAPFSILEGNIFRKVFLFATPSAFQISRTRESLSEIHTVNLDPESLFLFGNANAFEFFHASDHVLFLRSDRREIKIETPRSGLPLKVSSWRTTSQEPLITVSMHKKWEESYIVPLYAHIQITHSGTCTGF